jgi:hypothetical protein
MSRCRLGENLVRRSRGGEVSESFIGAGRPVENLEGTTSGVAGLAHRGLEAGGPGVHPSPDAGVQPRACVVRGWMQLQVCNHKNREVGDQLRWENGHLRLRSAIRVGHGSWT